MPRHSEMYYVGAIYQEYILAILLDWSALPED